MFGSVFRQHAFAFSKAQKSENLQKVMEKVCVTNERRKMRKSKELFFSSLSFLSIWRANGIEPIGPSKPLSGFESLRVATSSCIHSNTSAPFNEPRPQWAEYPLWLPLLSSPILSAVTVCVAALPASHVLVLLLTLLPVPPVFRYCSYSIIFRGWRWKVYCTSRLRHRAREQSDWSVPFSRQISHASKPAWRF